MGIVSGNLVVEGNCVTAPTNLLFRNVDNSQDYYKLGVDGNWNIKPGWVPAGSYNVFVRENNISSPRWARASTPAPFYCSCQPQSITVTHTC